MPRPVEIVNGKKTVTILENNPLVMNTLAAYLGLSSSLQFHDIYSLDPADNTHIPTPIHALLVILPLTPAWEANRKTEDDPIPLYTASGAQEPVVWFKQTIGEACGSIGLLHCLINGSARKYLSPDSLAAKIREDAIPLQMEDRARMLYDCQPFLDAHQSVAELGDTVAPGTDGGKHQGQHFVAFVKGDDGNLWELEGSRKGPLNRGSLEGEGVLSKRGVDLGIGRVIELDKAGGGEDLRYSCIALAGGEA